MMGLGGWGGDPVSNLPLMESWKVSRMEVLYAEDISQATINITSKEAG